jgi:ribosome maturation factor RimP
LPPVDLDRAREAIERRLDTLGYELVDLRLGQLEGRRSLEVLIDKSGGVGADDCQQVAGHVSDLMDALEPVPERYMLQVSSPGLDRPLRTLAHFERFAGSLVVVKLTETATTGAPGARFKARLIGVRDGKVILDGAEGEIAVDLREIRLARLEPEWDE